MCNEFTMLHKLLSWDCNPRGRPTTVLPLLCIKPFHIFRRGFVYVFTLCLQAIAVLSKTPVLVFFDEVIDVIVRTGRAVIDYKFDMIGVGVFWHAENYGYRQVDLDESLLGRRHNLRSILNACIFVKYNV